jgi:hypothetical protein
MTRRLAAPVTLAIAALTLGLAVSSIALADVPPADGGGTGGGTGGATTNPGCTITAQSVSGSTCQECLISDSDTSCQDELGADYNYVCTYSATEQIWCNGPDRNAMLSPGCALAASPANGALAGLTALALAALALRRRSRA